MVSEPLYVLYINNDFALFCHKNQAQLSRNVFQVFRASEKSFQKNYDQ